MKTDKEFLYFGGVLTVKAAVRKTEETRDQSHTLKKASQNRAFNLMTMQQTGADVKLLEVQGPCL